MTGKDAFHSAPRFPRTAALRAAALPIREDPCPSVAGKNTNKNPQQKNTMARTASATTRDTINPVHASIIEKDGVNILRMDIPIEKTRPPKNGTSELVFQSGRFMELAGAEIDGVAPWAQIMIGYNFAKADKEKAKAATA